MAEPVRMLCSTDIAGGWGWSCSCIVPLLPTIFIVLVIFLLGMLIFQNFISRYENFKSRDSSSTRNENQHGIGRQSMMESVVVLTSPFPHPLGINYRWVEARVLRLLALWAHLTLTCRCAGMSFSCLFSGGCDRFTVCCVSRCCFRPEGWPPLMLISLTFWRPLLPYGYNYNASCARSG